MRKAFTYYLYNYTNRWGNSGVRIKLMEDRILSGKDLRSYKNWVNAIVPRELGKIPKLKGHSQDWGKGNSSSQVSPFVLVSIFKQRAT